MTLTLTLTCKQPVVAVKVLRTVKEAMLRLKCCARLRVNGESTENDDENENKVSRTKQKLLGSEDAD